MAHGDLIKTIECLCWPNRIKEVIKVVIEIRRLARLQLRPVLIAGACGNLLPRRGVPQSGRSGSVFGGHRPMCRGLQRPGGTGQQFGPPLSARCAGSLRAYCSSDKSHIFFSLLRVVGCINLSFYLIARIYTIPLLLTWKPNSLVGHGSSPRYLVNINLFILGRLASLLYFP